MEPISENTSSRKQPNMLGMGEYILLFFALIFGTASILYKPLLALPAFILLAMAIRKPILVAYYIVLFHWSELIPVIGAKIEVIRYSLGPVNITINDALFALVSIVLLSASIQCPFKVARFLSNPLGKAIVIFTMYQFFHIAYSLYLGVALDTVIRESYKYLVCIYAMHVYLYFDIRTFKRLLKISYYLILFLPVFQVYMVATGEVWKTSSGTDRTYYIGVNIFYIAVIAYYMMQKKFNAKTVLIIFYMIAGMAMTQYRSAFLALLAVMALGAIYLTRDGKIDRVIIGSFSMVIVAIIGITVLSFIKPDYIDQTVKRYSDTFNTEDRNVVNRQYMWNASLEAFIKNPVIGVGSAKGIYSYIDDNSYLAEQQWSPHNFIMRIAAKEGIIGVVIMLLVIYQAYKLTSRLKNTPLITEYERRALVLLLVSLVIIQLMNTTFTAAKSNFIFWWLLGFLQIIWFSTLDAMSEKR